MKPVLLIPGFSASDLAIAATGDQIWFDLTVAAALNIGVMRLAPDGVSPGPPDGRQLGIIPSPLQDPWGQVRANLIAQMDISVWRIQVLPYDWRLTLETVAANLAQQIRQSVTPGEPATLVGHSAGGLVCVLAWANLLASGDSDKIRRIITIGTPFQGSYGTVQWLVGFNQTVIELLNAGVALRGTLGFDPAKWTLDYLSAIALSWPSFYELFPFLGTPDATIDPYRPLLFNAANYGSIPPVSQGHLDHAADSFQPAVRAALPTIPSWVLTTVAAQGLATPFRLRTNVVPLDLMALDSTQDGDGVVLASSAAVSTSKTYFVAGEHNSLPYGLAQSGELRDMILDQRGPLTPPSPPKRLEKGIGMNVTAPPESDPVSGLQCLSGG